jgi:hypothetical protein
MKVTGKDIIDLEIVEIGKSHRHIPLVTLIAEIAPGKEGIEQLAMIEHDLFLVWGQQMGQRMELIKDLFPLCRLKRDSPYQDVLILTRPVRVGEDNGILAEIDAAGISISVVIAGDKADPKAGVREEGAYVGPEGLGVAAPVEEVAADEEEFYLFLLTQGDEFLQGLPTLIAIFFEMDICGMDDLHRVSTTVKKNRSIFTQP